MKELVDEIWLRLCEYEIPEDTQISACCNITWQMLDNVLEAVLEDQATRDKIEKFRKSCQLTDIEKVQGEGIRKIQDGLNSLITVHGYL